MAIVLSEALLTIQAAVWEDEEGSGILSIAHNSVERPV